MPVNTEHYLLLGVTPVPNVDINDFFAGEYRNTFYQLLQNPPVIRRMGWSLETLDVPKIVEGKCYEVVNGDRKVIRLFRDGTLVTKVSMGSDFLGWGQNAEAFQNNPKLNTTAFVEFILNYFIFYARFLEESDLSLDYNFAFTAKLNGLNVGEQRIKLSPNPAHGSFNWETDFVPAPTADDKIEFEYTFKGSDLRNDPHRVAYKVVSEIFLWFGFSKKPPYSVDGKLSSDAFRNIV